MAPGGDGVQAEEPADAVLLVHHRRARREVRELIDQCFRIALPSPATPLAPALAQQFALRDDGDTGVGNSAAVLHGSDGQAQPLVAGQEGLPVLDDCGDDVVIEEQALEHLPAPGRFGRKQDAAGKVGQESLQPTRWLTRPHRDAQRRQRGAARVQPV